MHKLSEGLSLCSFLQAAVIVVSFTGYTAVLHQKKKRKMKQMGTACQKALGSCTAKQVAISPPLVRLALIKADG